MRWDRTLNESLLMLHEQFFWCYEINMAYVSCIMMASVQLNGCIIMVSVQLNGCIIMDSVELNGCIIMASVQLNGCEGLFQSKQ